MPEAARVRLAIPPMPPRQVLSRERDTEAYATETVTNVNIIVTCFFAVGE
jgi:hypothetical protein